RDGHRWHPGISAISGWLGERRCGHPCHRERVGLHARGPRPPRRRGRAHPAVHGMNGAPSPLKRIDHIVALVRNLDSAFIAYTQRLGFPISWQVESKEGWRSSALWLGNASLELTEPSSQREDGAGAFFRRALASRGEGLFLVAFEPPDIDYSVRALRTRGAQVADPVSSDVVNAARSDGLRGYRSAFISRRSTAGLSALLCKYDSPFQPLDGGAGALKVKKLDHVIIATEDLG